MNPIRGIRPSAPVSRTQQDLQGASTSRDHNDGGQGTAASFEYPEQWEGASEAEAEEEEEEGEQEEEDAEGDSGDEDEATSDTSSAMFDPEADPEGWAIRQDELAGVLEMGEEEARAIRWGSDMSKLDSGPLLPLEDFKILLNHHLATTEWRYASPDDMFPALSGRSAMDLDDGLLGDIGQIHPIRVLGNDWVGKEVGGPSNTWYDDHQARFSNGLGIHLPDRM